MCSAVFIGFIFFPIQILCAQSELPRTAIACYELGENLIDENPQEALRAFTEAIRLNPGFADAYYSRGLLREGNNQLAEALVDFSNCIDLQPQHAEALFSRAHLQYLLKHPDLSKNDFLTLLALPKGETSTIFYRQNTSSANPVFTLQSEVADAYFFFRIGLAELELQQFTLAVHWFDSALHITPTDADVFVSRGMAYSKLGQMNKAKRDFEKALQLHPNHSEAKHNLRYLNKDVVNEPPPLSLLDSAIFYNPDKHYLYAERAYQHLSENKPAAAIRDYSTAIELDSSQLDYFLNRGLAYERLKKFEQAYADYTHILRKQETNEKAWLNRGNVLMKLKRYADAVEDYSAAILFHPQYGTAYYNRALAHFQLKKMEDACRDANSAEQLGFSVPSSFRTKVCTKN